MINILLGITATVENTVILNALHKEKSLHKHSKVLVRNLVASDLCAGLVQFVSGVQGISVLQKRWHVCHLLYLVFGMAGNISITVSLCTITAISVDRLLALLLKIRYRQVVTLRKIYAVAIASWICSGIFFASLWSFSHDRSIILSVITVAVCLTISTYCYTRIFYRLRHQHTQVHSNLPEEDSQTTREDITRYRKTVSSAVWIQLPLLFCYLTFLLLMPFTYQKTYFFLSNVVHTTVTLMYFNSTCFKEDQRG